MATGGLPEGPADGNGSAARCTPRAGGRPADSGETGTCRGFSTTRWTWGSAGEGGCPSVAFGAGSSAGPSETGTAGSTETTSGAGSNDVVSGGSGETASSAERCNTASRIRDRSGTRGGFDVFSGCATGMATARDTVTGRARSAVPDGSFTDTRCPKGAR